MMKIKTIDASTKKPLTNARIQLQVKGKDSGFLTLTTTATGEIELDSKYTGQQITSSLNGQGPWTTASEGATLVVDTKQKATQAGSSTTGSTSGSSTGSQSSGNQGNRNQGGQGGKATEKNK